MFTGKLLSIHAIDLEAKGCSLMLNHFHKGPFGLKFNMFLCSPIVPADDLANGNI